MRLYTHTFSLRLRVDIYIYAPTIKKIQQRISSNFFFRVVAIMVKVRCWICVSHYQLPPYYSPLRKCIFMHTDTKNHIYAHTYFFPWICVSSPVFFLVGGGGGDGKIFCDTLQTHQDKTNGEGNIGKGFCLSSFLSLFHCIWFPL